MISQYARARTWLASAKDDWLLPLSKAATEELIAEHDELVKALADLYYASTEYEEGGPSDALEAAEDNACRLLDQARSDSPLIVGAL